MPAGCRRQVGLRVKGQSTCSIPQYPYGLFMFIAELEYQYGFITPYPKTKSHRNHPYTFRLTPCPRQQLSLLMNPFVTQTGQNTIATIRTDAPTYSSMIPECCPSKYQKNVPCFWFIMMASSIENIFRFTGPLCGEFTGHRWITAQSQCRGALMLSMICARINGWVNNHGASGLRRHCTHYDVIVMSERNKW